MNVKELIDLLQTFPKTAQVQIRHYNGDDGESSLDDPEFYLSSVETSILVIE